MAVVTHNSGNCNFTYLTALAGQEPAQSMREILESPKSYGERTTDPPRCRKILCGMYLFAQGSDDPVSTCPYGPKFKAYVEQHELGKVFEMPPVPNPAHYNKPGILYIWVIDHVACSLWFDKNVIKPWVEAKASKSK